MRAIDFEGCYNFRDLGGLRTDDGRIVRRRRLFRADAVHLMTEADVARARDELGLRTMLDLRNDLEINADGVGLLVDEGVLRHHFPLSSRRGVKVVDGTLTAAAAGNRSPAAMSENYLGILERSADLMVDAVNAIVHENALPAVFFCAAGKDRTGVLGAVILGALGVREADIVDDYVMSRDAIVRIIERFGARSDAPGIYRDLPPENFAPLAETMEMVVNEIERTYGSFGDYLLAKGLSEDSLAALRRALLDDAR